MRCMNISLESTAEVSAGPVAPSVEHGQPERKRLLVTLSPDRSANPATVRWSRTQGTSSTFPSLQQAIRVFPRTNAPHRRSPKAQRLARSIEEKHHANRN